MDDRSGLVWTIDAAFADEEDDIVFEFVGQGHAAQLQRTDPPGDFFGAEGGEHFVELFDLAVVVLVGGVSAEAIEFFVFVILDVATHRGEQAVFFAGFVQSTTTGRGTFANFGHFFESALANFTFQPPLSHETGDGGDNAENDEKEYEFCHV